MELPDWPRVPRGGPLGHQGSWMHLRSLLQTKITAARLFSVLSPPGPTPIHEPRLGKGRKQCPRGSMDPNMGQLAAQTRFSHKPQVDGHGFCLEDIAFTF